MKEVKKIIHVDMDAFYASVEQRDNPELKGKAISVGGSPKGRGVVAAASYEARVFGVRSAMSARHAKELCPEIVFVKPRFAAYKEVSMQVMDIFHRYTDLVEPLSLDEAYLDVTENKKGIPFATDIAKDIKREILEETSLTASAGVAPNKFLAKLGSDMNKPNGLTVIRPERIKEVLHDLPVRKIPGIGRVTEQKMARLGIFSTLQLREKTEEELIKLFGKSGKWYFNVSRGIDEREVKSERVRKSVGTEDTFSYNLQDIDQIILEITRLSEKTTERLQRIKGRAKTITLKVKYSDFQQITRSKTYESSSDQFDLINSTAIELLQNTEAGERSVRLLGVSLSQLEYENQKYEKKEGPGTANNEFLLSALMR